MVVSVGASVDCFQATRKRKRVSSSTTIGNVGQSSVTLGSNSIYTNVLNLDSNPSVRRHKRSRRSARDPTHSHEYLKGRFDSIQDSDKWFLPTGRSVEEVLFDLSSKLDEKEIKGSLYASYILLISNANPQPSHFTSDEWKAIKSSITPPPSSIARSALTKPYSKAKYPKDLYLAVDKDIIELEPVINTDQEEEFLLRRWVRNCYDHYSEGWLDMKLWSTFLDNCLLTIPQLDLDRGETSCRATAERRNRNRTNYSVRQRIGRRMDGIFLLRGGNELQHELGGIECGKFSTGGENGTKWLQDSQKLALAMRDMMVVLQKKYPAIRRRIRIVGVICLGLSMRTYIMENPSGQICTLQALDPVQIPVHCNPPLLERFILEVVKVRDILAKLVEELLDCESLTIKEPVEQGEDDYQLIYSLDTDGGGGSAGRNAGDNAVSSSNAGSGAAGDAVGGSAGGSAGGSGGSGSGGSVVGSGGGSGGSDEC